MGSISVHSVMGLYNISYISYFPSRGIIVMLPVMLQKYIYSLARGRKHTKIVTFCIYRFVFISYFFEFKVHKFHFVYVSFF